MSRWIIWEVVIGSKNLLRVCWMRLGHSHGKKERLMRQAQLKEFTEASKTMRSVNRDKDKDPLPEVNPRAGFSEI